MKNPPSTGSLTSTTPESEGASAVEELLAAGKALGQVIIPPAGHQPMILRPKDYVLESVPLTVLRPLPDHIRQQVELHDAESFVLYVKGFATAQARIFASMVNLAQIKHGSAGGAQFTAVLDYHEGSREQKAARLAHVVEYPVPLSLEFATWLGKNGAAQSQMDFINFIETNCVDVVSPDAASVMELALHFEAKSNVTFQSKVDRVTGGRSLVFQEQVEQAGAPSVGQMKVPDVLKLSLPVFEGGKLYPLDARLEYRPSGGKLTIAYHLQRPHNVFRLAWQDLRAEITAELGMAILTGSAAIAQGWDEVK